MKDNVLPEDADRLVSFGQSLITAMSEMPKLRGFNNEVEALLRSSLAGAKYGIDTYMCILVNARNSVLAASVLREARLRCDRNVEYLRRQIMRSVAQICRYLSNQDLQHVVQYVMMLAG